MSYRILAAALTAASLVLATQAFAEPVTVHGSKSNGSYKEQTTQSGNPSAAKATTVRSSRSNGSYKTGKPKGPTGPLDSINLNTSRSNNQ